LLQLVLFDCNTRDNQRWELLADGSLRNVGTIHCMDLRNGGTGEALTMEADNMFALLKGSFVWSHS